MDNAPSPEWTAEQIAAYAARFGFPLTDAMAPRLLTLANTASAVGRRIPRQPRKSDEPAYHFVLPTEKR